MSRISYTFSSHRQSSFIQIAIIAVDLFLQSGRDAIAQEDNGPSESVLAQSLGEKRNRQQDSLASFEVEYRSMRRKVPEGHDINREAVKKLLQKLALDSSAKSLKSVAAALDPRSLGQDPAWANGSFITDGESFRSEESLQGHKDMTRTLVQHGGYELHLRNFTENRMQVDVHWEQTKVRFGPREVSDFVVMPSEKIFKGAQLTTVPSEGGDRLSITKNFAEFVVSPNSGFVHELKRGNYGKGIYSETLQFVPQKYGQAVVLPKLYFQGRYSGDRLSSFTLRIIDKVTIDRKSKPADFQIAVGPNDNVIDHTGNGLEMVHLAEPTDDVIATLSTTNLPRSPLQRSK